MTRHALVLLEQALTTPSRNTAGLLPDPLRTPIRLAADDVLAFIRENRDTDPLKVANDRYYVAAAQSS
ncbi:hypothetical protein [Methyloglobulus sp.]|uniref:hypothetical protein n=1 Tax=Methyloglobulus sp. TaxID=2518622 RepID=UPI0039893D7D